MSRKISRKDFLKLLGIYLGSFLAACIPTPPSSQQSSYGNTPRSTSNPSTKPLTESLPNNSLEPANTSPATFSSELSPNNTSYPVETLSPEDRLNGTCLPSQIPQSTHPPAQGDCHIITALCLRDGSCLEVCPVDCIRPGYPIKEWPRYYIDPDTCINCGACIPECPNGAIFSEYEVPDLFMAQGGEFLNRTGFCGHYEGLNHQGDKVVVDTIRRLKPGEVIDLTVDIDDNYNYFEYGWGYTPIPDTDS